MAYQLLHEGGKSLIICLHSFQLSGICVVKGEVCSDMLWIAAILCANKHNYCVKSRARKVWMDTHFPQKRRAGECVSTLFAQDIAQSPCTDCQHFPHSTYLHHKHADVLSIPISMTPGAYISRECKAGG